MLNYTEAGVNSKDLTTRKETERKFDVTIFGTGFNVAQYLEHEKVIGVDSTNLQQQWGAHPEALYGISTHNFPNMFMCFGPNTATLWSSQQDNWKVQAKFAAMAIRAMDRKSSNWGRRFAMHPNAAVERKYNDDIQTRQEEFVWAEKSRTSYYKNDAGWITYTMPWSYPRYWWMLFRIKWDEWEVISSI